MRLHYLEIYDLINMPIEQLIDLTMNINQFSHQLCYFRINIRRFPLTINLNEINFAEFDII